MSKVSIIVPVYNVDKDLFTRCIESLASVELNDYEIIVVDDGSDMQYSEKDAYDIICKNYSIIKYIKKKHEGVVSARVEGLKVAVGTYIAFVDADDWVDDKFFTSFVSIMDSDSSIDICVGSMVRSYPDGVEKRICNLDKDKKMPMQTALEEMVSFSVFRWELCGKLYRRALFCGAPNDKIQAYEDLDWNWDLFSRANYVWYSGKFLYHYYVNSYSATQWNDTLSNSSLIVFRRIWNSQINNLQVRKCLYTHYAKNIFHNLQWLLIEDFEKNNHKYEIESYCQEFASIYQDVAELIDVSDLDYPNRKLVEIAHYGHRGMRQFFREYFLYLSKEIINLSKIYGKVYIYGTGNVSKYITSIMYLCNVPVFMYVVSDGQGNIKIFKNKIVRYFSELTVDKNNDVFILAMLKNGQEIVSNDLATRHLQYIKIDTKLLGFE